MSGAAVAAGAVDYGAPVLGDRQAGIVTQTTPGLLAAPPIETVRIVSHRVAGRQSLENFLKIPGCRITAVCDIRPERTAWASAAITAAGHPAPTVYARGPRDFQRLCETDDLDLVFNATPWRWHVPVCVEAMEAGKHAAVEVPAAYTLEGCWRLVETAERTERHCVMMENCNYGRAELMVLNLVRQGVLGELLHAEGAYIHDLRAIKFSDANEGLWRLEHSKTRNARRAGAAARSSSPPDAPRRGG
jgi:predicted dehydrogenase